MKRRTVVAGGALLLSWTGALRRAVAQASARVYRVGILGSEDARTWAAFRQALHGHGYVEGRNVVFEARWSEGVLNRLPALARELADRKVDVIVVSGAFAAHAAQAATRTTPIVMAVSGRPEAVGLVQSLARPGGNVTGLSNSSAYLHGKRLELLREVATVSRVVWLSNPLNPGEVEQPTFIAEIAAQAGVMYRTVEIRNPEDMAGALATAREFRADALMVAGNHTTFRARHRIAEFARANRLLTIFEERMFVDAGGLMSYGPSFEAMFRRAAYYVDRILKGDTPADLPIEQPTTFELAINLDTARAIGLTIPAAVLLRADHLVE
jgi:putative ABC transport system substrate-binding protein